MHSSIGLETRALSTGYRDRKRGTRIISQDLNLSIAPGELVMFMGPNGSGKSTLMHTIAGLIPPISGEVLIGGERIERQSPSQMARLLSLVLTERITSSAMTIRDVVSIGRYPHIGYLGRLSKEDMRIVDEAIELCRLSGMEERRLSELSDGERQRTMIARALTQQTPLILLDEPTAHLDLPSRLDIVLMLRQLAHELGRAVLVSTHELDLALSWADTIWLLDCSGTVASGVPEDLVLSGAVERTFGNESLRFDPTRGEFVRRIPRPQSIHLVGEGLEFVWTQRALNRLGYEVLPEPTAGVPSVSVSSGQWTLSRGEQVSRASSIEQLLSLL